MALFYTAKLRGTIRALNWGLTLHYRQTDIVGGASEPEICEALCHMIADGWEDYYKTLSSAQVVMTKVVVEAFDEPAGFYELTTAITGNWDGDLCPEFVALGLRFFRTNQDFRTATHRLPGLMEANNVGGSLVFDDRLNFTRLSELTSWLLAPPTYVWPPTVGDPFTFVPVLLRRQFTTGSEEFPPVVVTVLNPPEISDVGAVATYGITSQVSRKYIIPS